MTPLSSASLWKWVAGLLVSILVSGAAGVYSTRGDWVTKAEVRDALKPDHELIQETRDDVKHLNDKFDALLERLAERNPR